MRNGDERWEVRVLRFCGGIDRDGRNEDDL